MTGFMGAAVLIFTVLLSLAWTSLNELERQLEKVGEVAEWNVPYVCGSVGEGWSTFSV